MKTFVFAAVFLVIATPAAMAQWANPGTGPSIVYQNPIAGYGYGWGNAPGYIHGVPIETNRKKVNREWRARDDAAH
jgi:hypothetical protein